MSHDTSIVKNLIDLSADDVCPILDASHSSNRSPFTPPPAPIDLIPIDYADGRESLENNPFDCVQKQANRPDDPFEILSREASYQSHYAEPAAAIQAEVRTENLLCISDDSIKVEENTAVVNTQPVFEFSKLRVPCSRFIGPTSSVSSIESAPFSPCEDSAFTSRNDSSKTINKAFITDNTISSQSEDSRAQSMMNKGFVGSYSSFDVSQSSGNSTPECNKVVPENSDSSGKVRSQKSVDARKRLLKLSLCNSTSNSPLCRRPLEEENSSPLSSVFSEVENQFSSKFVFDSPKEFDDSCDDLMSIKPNWIDSETDIDSDLEMMKIPILQEIPSPVVSSKEMPWEETHPIQKSEFPVSCKNSPDLEALREKVQQHKAEKCNNPEVATLIDNLKQVIKNCANETKKAEAHNLLESLSKLLNDNTAKETSPKTDTLTPPPQPIVRQGTFDMDLKENEEMEEREKLKKQQTIDNPNIQIEDEIPQCSEQNISSGTHSLHSPEPEPQEVSDIVEQIGRLFSNQNVNVLQADMGTVPANSGFNPTYIVVMNTPIPPRQRPSINTGEYQNDGSPELNYSQSRRRSQSLSIHDKEKSFAIPLPPSPMATDCKTPGRAPMMRRNSFSSATPNTPSIQMSRRTMFGGSSVDVGTKQSQMQRRSSILETHHEKQQNPLQPNTSMSMNGIGFNAKKLKFKQSSESIVKSNGPMKATIPVKKVAPMIVTTNVDSPVEDAKKFKSVTSTPNVQQFPSKCYPNACSTPMVEASPIKRSGLTKSRYSFVAATPQPRQSTLGPSPSQPRRRTMSEMRSPKKIGEKPSSSGISKSTIKTVKLPQNFSKTISRLAPGTSKGTLRLTKPSVLSAADKNKENKLPKAGR